MKCSDIARELDCELWGEDFEIKGVCSLKNQKPSHVAFSNKDGYVKINHKLLILIGSDTYIEESSRELTSRIICYNPGLEHAKLTRKYFMPMHPGEYVRLPSSAWMGSHVLGNVSFGENFIVFPGAIIGSPGFGPIRDGDNVVMRPQVGWVLIGDNVEIGANNTIACGTIDDTIIGNNVKTDSQVHIAHNCIIGDGTLIAAGAKISGSVTIGKNCWLGTNCTIMNQITIGDNVTIGIGAVVVKDVPDNAVIAGMMGQSLERMQILNGMIDIGQTKIKTGAWV